MDTAASVNDFSGLPSQFVDQVRSADALAVGSPVSNGSYPSLFKHLFDLIDLLELPASCCR